MTLIPMFAFANDPITISVIRRNEEALDAFYVKATEFARLHSDIDSGLIQIGGWARSKSLFGIRSKNEPAEGRWKSLGHGMWAPFRKNPLHLEMIEISYKPEPVPGLSEAYDGPTRHDGSQQILFPRTFVWEGLGWFGLSGQPIAEQRSTWGSGEFGDQWLECLGTDYSAALIAHDEAAQKRRQALTNREHAHG